MCSIEAIEIYDEESDISIHKLEGLTYPSILLSNVKFKGSLKVLENLVRKSFTNVDVFIEVDGEPPIPVGQLPLDIKTLLMLKYLRIGVTVFLSDSDSEKLDLTDVNVLERFL